VERNSYRLRLVPVPEWQPAAPGIALSAVPPPVLLVVGIFTVTETSGTADGTDRPGMPLPVLPFSSVLSVESVVVWLFSP
jgi:hypothetical protein